MDEINKRGITDVYCQLVDCIGIENTRKLYEVLKGQQITFPKRFYKPEYVIEEVKRRYNGDNLRELAREFDYTERYLRKLMKDMI